MLGIFALSLGKQLLSQGVQDGDAHPGADGCGFVLLGAGLGVCELLVEGERGHKEVRHFASLFPWEFQLGFWAV